MKISDWRTKKTVILCSISLIIVLLSFLSIFMISFKLRSINTTDGSITDMTKYRLVEYDIDTQTTYFGSVEISRALRDEEYISYDNDDGQLTVISNFGQSEYVCHGTCYCESILDERKAMKAVGNNVARNLIYLLAATTSSAAMMLARNHFTEECQNEQQSICLSQESIKSEVDTCEKLVEDSTYHESRADSSSQKLRKFPKYRGKFKEGEYNRYFEHVNPAKYICSGNCLRTPNAIAENRDYPCENLRREESFEVGPGIWHKLLIPEDIFVAEFLWMYCWLESVYEEEFDYVDPKTKEYHKLFLNSAYCFGGETSPLGVENPSIKCKKLE